MENITPIKAKAKRKKSQSKSEKPNGLTAPKKLKILFTIVNRAKAQFYCDVLEGFEVNLQTVIYGRGTATSDIMHYLGLSDNSKAVIVSVVQEDKIKEITAAYEDKYFKTKNGNGIAFTVAMSSMIGVLMYQFLSNTKGE